MGEAPATAAAERQACPARQSVAVCPWCRAEQSRAEQSRAEQRKGSSGRGMGGRETGRTVLVDDPNELIYPPSIECDQPASQSVSQRRLVAVNRNGTSQRGGEWEDELSRPHIHLSAAVCAQRADRGSTAS